MPPPISSSKPITLILFDAFDTLLTPRIPIHIQYAQEALRAGLTDIDPDKIRGAFRGVFKEVNERWPNYGKGMRMTSEYQIGEAERDGGRDGLSKGERMVEVKDWWEAVIEGSLIGSGVDSRKVQRVMPRLGPALMRRFGGSEGYSAFDDVIPALKELKRMEMKMGVVSNADDRIVNTLSSLEISPFLSIPTTISYITGYEKPHPSIFHSACLSAGLSFSKSHSPPPDLSHVLMVGDELLADYHGALKAGLQAVLIRRPGDEFSDGAKREKEDVEMGSLERDGVRVVKGMEEVVNIVKRNKE